MYNAISLSPMIPSYNVKETMLFFVTLFDFEIVMDGDYSIVKKDGYFIHILRAGTDIGEIEFYFEVNDVDGLWNSLKDQLPVTKVKPPFNRDYGMREFHIIIPYTKALMFVGEVINQ